MMPIFIVIMTDNISNNHVKILVKKTNDHYERKNNVNDHNYWNINVDNNDDNANYNYYDI